MTASLVLSLTACGEDSKTESGQSSRNSGTVQGTPADSSKSGQNSEAQSGINVNDGDFEIKDGVLVKYRGESKDVTVPSGVVAIGNSAFNRSSYVENVTLPDGVTAINGSAFMGCSNLKSVKLPDSVTSIDAWAFSDCENLSDINLPDINEGVFQDCTSLKNVTIPNSVTSIRNVAFYGCTSLESLTLPESVTELRGEPFEGCTSLTNLEVSENSQKYSSKDGVLYNKEGTRVRLCPPGKTTVSIPDGVTEIGNSAFVSCVNLTSVTIPDSVTEINEYAFHSCAKLADITIPDNVELSGTAIFYGCVNVKVSYKGHVYDLEHIDDLYSASND